MFLTLKPLCVCTRCTLLYLCAQVYTVGPDYAHAEARKSPALDGKVERNKDGKEIRYPVLLSAKEKLIARTVCLAFKVDVMFCLPAVLVRSTLQLYSLTELT